MYDYKSSYKTKIAEILTRLVKELNSDETISSDQVTVEVPPNPEMGDLGFPMFAFAKLLRKGPPQIAQLVAAELPGAFAMGPYVNLRLDRSEVVKGILSQPFSRPESLRGSRIVVEFSSPNTNKPLHLGHLRNDALGESVGRILSAAGADVRSVNLINDRGIHICKSMLAYKNAGGGKTPQSEGRKSDHFVGDYYVLYNNLEKENPALEE